MKLFHDSRYYWFCLIYNKRIFSKVLDIGEITLKQKIKTKREKSTSTVGHYVRNADLLPAVIAAKEKGVITKELIVMIQLIANNYSKKWRFSNYSYREDMVSVAVENLCKNALKFDTEKYTNPFSYYTSAIHNSFLQYMSEEKKHRVLRDKLRIDAGVNPSFGFKEGESDSDDSGEYIKFDSDSVTINFDSDIPDEDLDHEKESENEEEITPYDRIGYRERAPGKVFSFNPNEMYLDPVRGVYVKKGEQT